MHARQLDVLHHGGDEDVFAVAERVGLALERVVQEAVEVERAVGRDADGHRDVFAEHLLVVDDLHPAAAEDEARTDHERVADLAGGLERLREVRRHARLGHRDAELVHDGVELVAVLGRLDGVDGRAEHVAAGVLEAAREVERGLAAELDDDAQRLLGLVDLQHVLERDGLEVELVRGVVVGRDGLRVAVHHDRLVAGLAQRHRGVDAAVVELDALADAVRAAAEDEDLLPVVADRDLARLAVVAGVVVGGVLDAGDGDLVPGLDDAQRLAPRADGVLLDAEQLREIFVGEAVALGLDQQIILKHRAAMLQDFLLLLHEFAHLLDEIRLDAGELEDLLVRGALAQRLVHLEVALGGGRGEHLQQLVEGLLVEVLGEAEAGAAALERADGLLERLLVGLADRHHLADGLHLRAELVLDAAELLERPARELEHHVVAGGRVFLERAVAPVGDLVHRHAARELGGDERDREAGRLGGERGGARRAGVDLDDHDAARLRIVGELDVGAADDADLLDDAESVAAEALLELLVDREERRGAVGVARVDADGVDVLDEADRDHLVLRVADDLDLELLPVEDRLLDEALVRERGVEAAGADRAQLLDVVAEAAAGAAHRVGGADHDREADLLLHKPLGLLDRVDDAALGRLDAELGHRRLEDLAVLAALDRVEVDADHLHAVLVEDALLRELHREVEARLAAEVRQERVGALLGDDLLEAVLVERLDVGGVGHDGVRHDRGGVRVHQHDLVAAGAQRLAGLGAGVVELAGLADDDRTRTDDEDLVDVFASGHGGGEG